MDWKCRDLLKNLRSCGMFWHISRRNLNNSLELQLNDDFTHVLAHCSPILATEIHLTAVSPILSQRIFFPCKIINLIPPRKNSSPRGPRVSVKFYPSWAAVIDIGHYRRLYNNNFIKVHVNIINLMKLIEETHNFTTRWKKILKCKNMSNQKVIYR